MDLHRPVDPNKTYEQMSGEERLRYDHQKLHEAHAGHEGMHAGMLLVLVGTLVLAQVAIVQWKQRHHRSYATFTLLAMWVIPVGVSARNAWWRFVVLWALYTACCALVVRAASRRPVANTTPRLVYKWFYLVYKASCLAGVLGYVLMMLTFLGVNLLTRHKPQQWMDVALLLLFYGLYFGVLGRDLAEYCTDKMAVTIGYSSPDGMPTRRLDAGVCSVCANPLLTRAGEEGVLESTFRLACGHEFHEFCLRGWCIVGKKQTCPYCREKVDLARSFPSPWDRGAALHAQLLDWVRWLVAWQPLVLFLVQAINWALGLE